MYIFIDNLIYYSLTIIIDFKYSKLVWYIFLLLYDQPHVHLHNKLIPEVLNKIIIFINYLYIILFILFFILIDFLIA